MATTNHRDRIITYLAGHRSMTTAQIAAELGLSVVQTARVLKGMEADQLVRKTDGISPTHWQIEGSFQAAREGQHVEPEDTVPEPTWQPSAETFYAVCISAFAVGFIGGIVSAWLF